MVINLYKLICSSAQNTGYLEQNQISTQTQQHTQTTDAKWMLVKSSLYAGLSSA